MKMITDTILAVQRYKSMDIITASDMNICIQNLEMLYKQLKSVEILLEKKQENNNFEEIITVLQKINNELSALFRTTGTQYICDIIMVAMGNDFLRDLLGSDSEGIFEVIKAYTHPISYIVLPWRGDDQKKKAKQIAKNRIVEDFTIVETSNNFDCFDLARTSKEFNKKVYGIKVAIHNPVEKKTLIISGIVDDVLIDCTNHIFIKKKLHSLKDNRPNEADFLSSEFDRFCDILTIKELLIYRNGELYQRFSGYINQTHLIKQKPISQNVKEFIGSGLFGQRRTLIQLLLKHNDPEFQYLAYLLYDLLSNDSNGNIDTVEQTVLFDSLPWNIKKYFRDAMKTTINYTRTLANFDNNKIPIEQQICLLKANDNIKEKAMLNLKEVKAKSEDSGSKARQYLEGLLKIPCGIYRKEYILCVMDEVKENFKAFLKDVKNSDIKIQLPPEGKTSSLEIAQYFPEIENNALSKIKTKEIERYKALLCKGKRDTLIANTCFINGIIKKHNIGSTRLCHSGKKNGFMRDNIRKFIDMFQDNNLVIDAIKTRYKKEHNYNTGKIATQISLISDKRKEINTTLDIIDTHLDKAVHGHKNAKRQLKRIIGQWINGEQQGYCFGFEGPPGVGKTSLAKKGLANCLSDKDSGCRPFAFIPIGGSSNGSTLSGHNYTYVGSTWGRIVDILMETKCMNPIIFIDELDKVSRSENGKEIIGILTHLVDETQNESFQDKYFSGIDLDLSKALFIFSYNDPDMIDRILLD
ncbi:MAG: AAA family ATPase, partial [Candidatus Neomarinimicrobiota bacterium]